jgi:S1-C subfamily serine protease
MARFILHLSIVALILFSFLIALSLSINTLQSSVEKITQDNVSVPYLDESPTVDAPTHSTSTPEKIVEKKKDSLPATQKVESTITDTVKTPPVPVPDAAMLDAAASKLRAALVNIICYAPAGSVLRSTSGSGVIIDPNGIILTNAHVAQNFLLEKRGVSCTIRSGSPAAERYEANLIYISPPWIRTNAKLLTEALPIGTGQYDFAFLAITKSTTPTPLPTKFPYISLATRPVLSGTQVVIASYGAQFISSSQIQSALFPTIVFGSVKDIFTFDTNTIDVLALGGSAAAQEGSSGGGVADGFGNLVGVITTSTVTGTTDTRSLDAITASYIRGEYASETGNALELFLAKPIETSIEDFVPQIHVLESILTASLN